jgi:leucyl aminopeptidase
MPIQILTTSFKPTTKNLVLLSKSEITNDLDKKLGSNISQHFKGELKECVSIISNGLLYTLCGIDDGNDIGKVINAVRSSCFKLEGKISIDASHRSESIAAAIVFGATLSEYRNNSFKTETSKRIPTEIKIFINKAHSKACDEAVIAAQAQMNAMHLVDTPSNVKVPLYIADYAKKSAKKNGFVTTIFDAKKLAKLKMDALLAVGQGSMHETCLIVMEYKPANSKSKTPTLGLVGKGITFDTGGISIKPSTNMAYMKSDMGGGAAVIGALELIARLRLDIHVVGIVPCAENAVDSNSIRPGDVISSYSGKTIEVIDTDAEGRLILADGIAYLNAQYKPDNIIDLATLTGSVIGTLGSAAAGMFSVSDDLASIINSSGENTQSKVWRLPLWDEYASEMNSEIADIKNLSTKPVAGAITAAKFLEFFTEKHSRWAHLDIAGVAFTDNEFSKSRSASGYGVRLLTDIAKQLSLSKKQKNK